MKRLARTIVAAAAFVMFASLGHAEESAAPSWSLLKAKLKPGDMVEVLDACGNEMRGTLETLSPASLTLVVEGNERALMEREIARVSREHRRTVAGLVWGLGIGVGAGLASASVECGLEQSYCPGHPLYRGAALSLNAGAIGAGIGAAIGVTKHAAAILYRTSNTCGRAEFNGFANFEQTLIEKR